jgi:SAM-dependent methyltransferase
MMAPRHYVIRGGVEGRDRLRVLARVMWPTTSPLLAEIGLSPSARCLDVGCGGGDVSLELARLVPDGHVVGVDLDEAKLAIARGEAAEAGVANVEFRVEDIMEPPSLDDRYDVAYARFVLTHLPDPVHAVRNICSRLAPGGVVVVEDIDFSGSFCHPDSVAFGRYVDWYTRAVQGRGGDPNIGPRLPAILHEAGLEQRAMHVVQPAGFSGDVKLMPALTLEAIAGAVVSSGLASEEEVTDTVDELYAIAEKEDLVLSGPRVVQAWGRRPRD